MVSFDTSTNHSGWALFVDGKYKQSGIINTPNGLGWEEKVNFQMQHLKELMNNLQPDVVVIEDLHVPDNDHFLTNERLAEIIGCVRSYCIDNEIPICFMNPTTWRYKLNITGKKTRAEYKAESIAFVQSHYHKDVTDDEADAINVGTAYCLMKMKHCAVKFVYH